MLTLQSLRFSLYQLFREEKFGISSQITRPAVSIRYNIVEESSRTSNKDYNRFLQMSLGSTFELETNF